MSQEEIIIYIALFGMPIIFLFLILAFHFFKRSRSDKEKAGPKKFFNKRFRFSIRMGIIGYFLGLLIWFFLMIIPFDVFGNRRTLEIGLENYYVFVVPLFFILFYLFGFLFSVAKERKLRCGINFENRI